VTRGLFPAALLPYAAVGLGLYALGSAWTALALYAGGMILVLARRRVDAGTLLRGWRAREGLLFAGFGVFGGVLLTSLWGYLALDARVPAGLVAVGLQGIGVPLFLVAFSVGIPPLEELFWRADPGAGELSDLLFAGYHALVLQFFLPGIWVGVAVAALVAAAALWRLLARRLGGLAVPWVSHTVADLALAAVVLLRL
jgi:hypothetical protein